MFGEESLNCSCAPMFSGRHLLCSKHTFLYSYNMGLPCSQVGTCCVLSILSYILITTIYMHTNTLESPRIIAEYGQEYGKDNPIRVLYEGYGHYDALLSSLIRTQSRL
jgi:hypothetical protein